jgi:hypothetical protein
MAWTPGAGDVALGAPLGHPLDPRKTGWPARELRGAESGARQADSALFLLARRR